jgi:uncharacterized membrane protein
MRQPDRPVAGIQADCKGGQAASRLGEAGININYGYCVVEPGTNARFLIFGGAEADKVLDQAAAAGATI